MIKDLELLAKRTKKFNNANEFVAHQIFSQSTSGATKRAIEDNFNGETFADKLISFYNQVRG